jgi:hypothetical protein
VLPLLENLQSNGSLNSYWFVFLGLIGITGLIGNSVVCYIYGAVYTQSNSRIFLICLAGIDLCTCIIDIPLEIINVLNQYEFSEPLLCKFSRSGNTLTTFYSTDLTLRPIRKYKTIKTDNATINKSSTIKLYIKGYIESSYVSSIEHSLLVSSKSW